MRSVYGHLSRTGVADLVEGTPRSARIKKKSMYDQTIFYNFYHFKRFPREKL